MPSYAPAVSDPHFSVLCPAHNARLTIEATMRSVRAQTYEDFEMVIVDDGSSDETAELIEAFSAADPRIRLIRQANAGTAGARNRALAAARGELISMIDNDDMWTPDYLASVAEAMDGQPEIGLCFSDIWMMSDRTGRVHRQTIERLAGDPQKRVIPAKELELALLADNFIPASATTLSLAALEATGGFDSTGVVKGSDDWDLWLRVAHAGFGAIALPGALAVWRDRDDSESKDRLMMFRSANAAARGALERNPDDPEIQAAARAVIDQTDREIAGRTDGPLTLRMRAEVRRKLSSTKYRMLRSREWREPPEELRRYLAEVDPPGSR